MRNRKGFTLIELILVIAILGISSSPIRLVKLVFMLRPLGRQNNCQFLAERHLNSCDTWFSGLAGSHNGVATGPFKILYH